MRLLDYTVKLLGISETIHRWHATISALEAERREKVARYAERSLPRSEGRRGLHPSAEGAHQRAGERIAIRELGRISATWRTSSALEHHLDGRKLTGVKRRLEQLAAHEPMRAAVRGADAQRIERLVEAEGYFRALADGLRHDGRRYMQKFTKLTAVAAPLPMINIDTDAVIPKQFLKTIKRTGLGKHLFHELRYDEQGKEKPDFVLNKPAYRKAQILVAGENFGCGSSREHAPWALLDFGIRCVISTSFADIFYNNCFQNGVLPIKVSQEDLDKLMDDANRGANATITVDLEKQEIRGPDGGVVTFEMDPFRKRCLLEGLDNIGLTLQEREGHRRLRETGLGRAPLGLI